jgi:hypothetical protein
MSKFTFPDAPSSISQELSPPADTWRSFRDLPEQPADLFPDSSLIYPDRISLPGPDDQVFPPGGSNTVVICKTVNLRHCQGTLVAEGAPAQIDGTAVAVNCSGRA